jgi:hypothetical protein
MNIKPRRRPNDTKQRVIQLLKEEWEKLSKEVAHNLVASLPHRCQEVEIDRNTIRLFISINTIYIISIFKVFNY